uniref:RING-type domain-containing protein n=1 Tax=Mesocestoides corti TaxID=53468 RepID=A0A5K3FBH6_MESCO
MASSRGYDICSICLSRPRNPFILSNCRHYFCGSCLQDLIALNDNLSCPNCRASFYEEEIRPVVIPALYTRYCMDMECPPHSDCKKLHVDSFITKKPQTTPDPPPEEVPRPTTPETWKPPPDATFCFDVFCPGGKEARCGKTHEEDFNFH